MHSTTSRFVEEGFGLSAAWVDLLNSQHWDGFGAMTDHLDDPSWVECFARRWGLRRAVDSRAFVPKFRVLRGSLRRWLERWAARRTIGTRDARMLDDAIRTPVSRRFVREGSSFTVEIQPLRDDWPWMRAEIVAPLAEAVAGPEARRIKMCPNPGCRWVFVDTTRSNSRIWCRDASCGNRERVRRSRRGP